MQGLLVVTTVVAALIVGTLAARPVHAEGPGTTDRPALAEVVFAGAPWRRSAACWSHTMSIRVVAVQVSVLSNGEATVSVTAEQSRRSVDPASGRLLEERVLQRVACRLVLEEGCWLSASEAAQRFTCGDVPHWLRPDGAGTSTGRARCGAFTWNGTGAPCAGRRWWRSCGSTPPSSPKRDGTARRRARFPKCCS